MKLVDTIAAWVYNKKKAKNIIAYKLETTGDDIGNAATFLTRQAFSKFRPGYPQGQFGELLLFNFIQYFFEAVPLLRKQRITTAVGHERFGADAVHFKLDGEKNVLILGESKCYESSYKFKNAFETSLASILTTFDNFDKELNLYTYDDFIEPELESIAKSYKEGTLNNIHFELVCLIAYNETKELKGKNEAEIKANIISIIEERCKSIDGNIYSTIKDAILDRINYIIFPVWELDVLLKDFQKIVGSTK